MNIMLWRCEIVHRFWTALRVFINEKCTVASNIRLRESIVLLGVAVNFKSDGVFDFILLFAKKYVLTNIHQNEINATLLTKI